MVSIIYFSGKGSGWVSETFFQAALWFFKNLGWKIFSGLGPEILTEASFLWKPTKRDCILEPTDPFQLVQKIRSSPPLNTVTLYFSRILETVFILSNTNSLKELFQRVLFQWEKYHLPGPSIPESLYSREKLLIPGLVRILSWVFMVLHQTSTFSHNMTWIV